MNSFHHLVLLVALIWTWFEIGLMFGWTDKGWFRPTGYVIWLLPILAQIAMSRARARQTGNEDSPGGVGAKKSDEPSD